MTNFDEKYEDLEKLHENKVITTFQMLLLHRLKSLNDAINGDDERTLVNKLTCIYGSIDDLNNESNEELTDVIQKGFINLTSSIYDK